MYEEYIGFRNYIFMILTLFAAAIFGMWLIFHEWESTPMSAADIADIAKATAQYGAGSVGVFQTKMFIFLNYLMNSFWLKVFLGYIPMGFAALSVVIHFLE